MRKSALLENSHFHSTTTLSHTQQTTFYWSFFAPLCQYIISVLPFASVSEPVFDCAKSFSWKMFLNCRLSFLQIKCIFSSKRFTREPISFPESSLPWPAVGNRPRAPRAGAKSWASWVELPRALAFRPLVNENKNSGNEITRKFVLKQRSYDNWKTAYWARVDPQCQFWQWSLLFAFSRQLTFALGV